jgi:hypothetical protein
VLRFWFLMLAFPVVSSSFFTLISWVESVK